LWDGSIIPLGDADCTPLVDVNQCMWNWDWKRDSLEGKKVATVLQYSESRGKGKEVEKPRESAVQMKFNYYVPDLFSHEIKGTLKTKIIPFSKQFLRIQITKNSILVPT